MQCNGQNISVIDDGSGTAPTAQTAVVGQQILLNTTPAATDLTALGLSFTKNKWTAGPPGGPSNNVGAYTMTATGTKITQTVLTKPGQTTLTTYWLYPNPNNPVTYQYCVNIPGLSAADVKNGLNCSLPADAAFNSVGPTAKITTAKNPWIVSRPIPSCLAKMNVQVLILGTLNSAASTSCDIVLTGYGIAFNATISILPGESGTTEWIQLIDANTLTGSTLWNSPVFVNGGTGLDGLLPYNKRYPDSPDATESTTNDAPSSTLSQDDANETRTFKADMYLMWTSQISGSISVPLGYVHWETSGTAVQNESKNPPWSLGSSGPTTATFKPGTDNGAPAHGLPTWSHLVKAGTLASAADEGEEEEEEQ
jgi:hypothetical protein